MSGYVCGKCGETKTRDEMGRYSSGVAAKTCVACGGKRAEIRVDTRRKPKPKPKPTRPQPYAPKPNGKLAIAAGFGIECRVEDGKLVLEQRDSAGEVSDQIVLSRLEAESVVHWIDGHAETAA